MSGRWIRLDALTFESDWVVELHPLSQLAWVRLLLYVKVHGRAGRAKVLGPTAVERMWGVHAGHRAAMLEAAHADGALKTEDGHWIVTGWDTYQEPDRTRAERQARWRENNGVTPVTDRYDLSMSMSLSGVDSQEEGHGEKPKKKKREAWRFCPEGWEPNESHHALAAELRVDLAGEAAKFRDHEYKTPKTDPDRAFSTWLRNARAFGGPAKNADPSERLRTRAERTAEFLRNQGVA